MVQLVNDCPLGGDQGRDFQPGDAPHVVNGQHVERIGHGQEELVLQSRDGHDFMVVRHFAGE